MDALSGRWHDLAMGSSGGTEQDPHKPRAADYLWASLAVLVASASVYIAYVGELELVALVILLVPAYWFGMGAWRRTTWGCQHPESCPRHSKMPASPGSSRST
jgi:hypothetical protein